MKEKMCVQPKDSKENQCVYSNLKLSRFANTLI